MKLAMGIYDAPEKQAQPVFYLEPLKNNVAVFGGPMSGKTTFIKTLLVRLHQREQIPNESIYIIDFSGNMGEYSKLPNVCACFDNSNEENVKRVFKAVEAQLAKNVRLLKGQSFVGCEFKNQKTDIRHIIFIIENFNSFLADERYDSYQEVLMKLCRDGLSKGLTVVFTANDCSGISRWLPNFRQKIAFDMPKEGYMEIFGSKVGDLMKLPGRGYLNVNESVYEFQAFLPFVKEEHASLSKIMKQFKGKTNANRLVAFDEELSIQNYGAYSASSKSYEDDSLVLGDDSVIIGLDYYEHQPVAINFDESRSLAIYGKRQFGKTNVLRLIRNEIKKKHGKEYRFLYLDDGRKQLEEFDYGDPNDVYFTNPTDLRAYLVEKGYGAKPAAAPSAGPRTMPPPRPDMLHRPTSDSTAKKETPFTVFVLQSKALYQTFTDSKYLMSMLFPKMISDAEKEKYLFIFTDVRSMVDGDMYMTFNNMISAAILLDSIGDFIAEKGNRTVFGDMNAKELRAEYARCAVGDGYYYDIESDVLKKLKFIKTENIK